MSRWVVLAAFTGTAAALLLLLWLGVPVVNAWRSSLTPDFPAEQFFPRENGATRDRFGSLLDPASITLSVVVPAYNEQARLPVMLDEMFLQLSSMSDAATAQCKVSNGPDCERAFTWEIIVVDDGSPDATASVAQSYVSRWGSAHLRLLRLVKNMGKGGAVRKGIMRARGEYILFADADGATSAAETATLLEATRTLAASRPDGFAFAVGSRAHMYDASPSPSRPSEGGQAPQAPAQHTVQRSWLRRVLMGGFHAYMSLLVGTRTAAGQPVRDTQAGFKMFSRR